MSLFAGMMVQRLVSIRQLETRRGNELTATRGLFACGLAMVCLAFACLNARPAGAQSTADNLGRGLFEREWSYSPPALPDQGDLSDAEYGKQLLALPGDGLGPMHNARSCADCHAGGGAAGVERNVTLLTVDPRSPAMKIGLSGEREEIKQVREQLVELYPGILSPFGSLNMDVVVHEQSTRPFYEGIRSRVAARIPDGAPDAWFISSKRRADAVASQPVLAGRHADIDFYLSQRNSPPLFGLGLIDRIEMSQLARLAASQAKNRRSKVTGRVGAGKFGWRAQTPTLDQFVRGACAGELGLQVARTPQTQDLADETYVSLGVDMQEQEVRQLVHFVQQLPEPRQETRLPTESVDARSGQRLFAKIGCIECHVQHVAPARHIYSDLLLHDMGRLLQAPAPAPLGISGGLVSRIRVPFFAPERRPIGSGNFRFSIGGYYGSPSAQLPTPFAMQRPSYPKFPRGQTPDRLYDRIPPHEWTWDRLQREWRTPPLWGVADSAPYLHDGRAETLDAAILWHGGEAQDSTTKYRSLSRDDRRQVVAFLKSLRAPVVAARQPERSVSEQMAGTMAFQFLNDEHQRAALRDAAAGVSVFDRPW